MDAMARARSTPVSPPAEPDFEPIADQLYAVRPDEFAAARDDSIRKARAEGRQGLARQLSQLRRPTQSAWLVNLLWRDQHDVMEQLFQLADELRRAQSEAAGSELRTLTAQRRQIEAALLRRANELAEKAGVNVADATAREAQETLSAALASPQVADEVRTGRLVKPASYAGFGVLPAARAAAAPQPKPAEPSLPDELQTRAAQRARERREAAERRVREARAAVEAAAAELGERDREAQLAQAQHEELRGRLERLQQQLRDLQRDIASAGQAETAAARSRDQAERTHAAARQSLERAEKDLQDLAD
jgi:hypothetical protein